MGNSITIPSNLVPIVQSYWEPSKIVEEDEDVSPQAREAMGQVMNELKRMFQEDENLSAKLEDSWLLMNSSIGPEDSPAIMRSQEEGEGLGDDASPENQATNVTTLAWANPDKVLSFVSYLWPKKGNETEVGKGQVQILEDDELKKQMKEQIQIIEKMREEINFLHESIMERPSVTKIKVWPTVDTNHIEPITNHNVAEIAESFVDGAPPPPPPPPPPGNEAISIRPSIAIGTISLMKKEKKPMSRSELEKSVRELVNDSDIMQQNREKVAENFVKAFPIKNNNILEQLVTHYPFLVRKMPLKPLTCYSRMTLWEKNLFKQLPEEKQVTTLRAKKKFEIEKLEKDSEILEEIKRIKEYLETQKKKEEEEKKGKR